MKSRLIFGCGYVGRRVADEWRAAGDRVTVATRSPARADELARAGFQPLIQDLAERWTLSELPAVDTVLFAVGFDRSADHAMRSVYVDGLEKVLGQLSGKPRFVYVSTTGVYGDSDGDWMDEDSICRPTREGGRLSLEAERLIQSRLPADRFVILRSAGIYGPDRVPNLTALRNNDEIRVAPDSWLNLIHVDDLVSAIRIAADSITKSSVYNVSDGSPVLRRDYYGYLGARFGFPSPWFAASLEGAPERQRNPSSKRIANRRILADLNLELSYPSYREGIDASVDFET